MRRPQSAQEWVLSNGLGAAVLDAFLPPNESVKHQTAPGGDACILQHLFVSTAWRLVSSGFELPASFTRLVDFGYVWVLCSACSVC